MGVSSIIQGVLLLATFSTIETYDVMDLIHYFRTDHTTECAAMFHIWPYDVHNRPLLNAFMADEKQLFAECTGKSNPFHVRGILDQPSVCETVMVCNISTCVVLPETSSLFTYTLQRHCLPDIPTNPANPFMVLSVETNATRRPSFKNVSRSEGKKILDSFTATIQFEYSSSLTSNLSENDDLRAFMKTNFKKILPCNSRESQRVLVLEGIGELPDACSSIQFCNEDTCTIYPHLAISNGYLRGRLPWMEIYLKNSCLSMPIKHEMKRSVIRHPIPSANVSTDLQRYHPIADGLLHFNLPGYRYCGPGTVVEKMDDLGGPINQLDTACRQHDVNYIAHMNPEKADAILLQQIYELGHPFLPIFVGVFEAKRYFEKVTGDTYTSSLYYVPDNFQQSLTLYFADSSSYDNSKYSSTEGQRLENRWKSKLRDIWEGYCYSKQQDGDGDGDQQSSSQGWTPSIFQHRNTGGRGTCSKLSQINQPGDMLVDVQYEYPQPSANFDPCRLIISEIAPYNGDNAAFLELRKVCPKDKRTRKTLIGDHYVILVEVGNPSTIYMSHSLRGQSLTEKLEKVGTGRRPLNNYYYVIGSPGSNPNTQLSSLQNIVVSATQGYTIPSENGKTFAVVLIYLDKLSKKNERRIEKLLEMPKNELGNTMPRPIEEDHRVLISSNIQDIAIYGSPCQWETCGEVLQWYTGPLNLQPDNQLYVPIPYPSTGNLQTPMSASECSQANLPMQIEAYQECVQTPGEANKCVFNTKPIPFKMAGIALQTTAQKIIVNAHNYFETYVTNPEPLQGTARFITATVTGISDITVGKILTRWKTDTILTPGKKRTRPKPVRDQIDGFYADMIRRIIKGIYAQNRPPLFKNIFDEFKHQVAGTEEARRSVGEQFIPFSCSEWTFRKILRALGYKYGKINMRDVVLTRPDIVKWRRSYLQIMDRNRKSSSPKPAIFIDETWIDVNGRTGKAWILKITKDYIERSEYSYKKHKVSKGPRLIILNAGGKDGFIEGAMDVFPVAKKDANGDYHDNVNGEYFIKWFKKLLDLLKDKGPHLIVIDNAPYHGSAESVKFTNTKLEIYDWLKDNVPLSERVGMLPITEYTKTELWTHVQELKKRFSFFRIDQMAQREGHEVVRLPPYNCDLNPIELVWKDVKHEVRKLNTDQNLATVKRIAEEYMKNYSAEKWAAHVAHVENLEREYWIADGVQESYMADNFQLIIPVTDNDDDEDECSADDLPVTSSPCVATNSNGGENDEFVEEEENDLHLEQGALDDDNDLDFSFVMYGDNNVIPVDPHVYTSDVHDLDFDSFDQDVV